MRHAYQQLAVLRVQLRHTRLQLLATRDMSRPTVRERGGTHTCADRFRLLFRSASISIAWAFRVRSISSYSSAYWSSINELIFSANASSTKRSTSYFPSRLSCSDSSSAVGGSIYVGVSITTAGGRKQPITLYVSNILAFRNLMS